MNIEKATKQINARKRLVFSFNELPEVKEALEKRDEVRAAVAESLAKEPLKDQAEKIRNDILKMLRKMDDEQAADEADNTSKS